MSLNWDQKAKVEDVGSVYFLGELNFVGEPKKSESGSEYHLIRLTAQPRAESTGVMASTNFMIDPSWLSESFHPNDLKQDEIEIQDARRVRKSGAMLSSAQEEILRLAGQDFLFSKNVYGRRSILRNMFDEDSYNTILAEGAGMDPLEFLKFIKTSWESMEEKPITIIQAQQTEDQDGDLSNRFEITEIVGIWDDDDLENFGNYRSKKARLLFDLESV